MTTPTMTAKELLARLQRHHVAPGEPGGVFLPEVTHGAAGGRRVDALYVGFYRSRGRILHGHELKVSRSDWVHELEQPGKGDVWINECHSWHIVAPNIDIVRPEELPPDWGLMVVDPKTKTRLRIVVPAKLHPDRNPSWEAAHSIIQRLDTLQTRKLADVRTEATDMIDRVGNALQVNRDDRWHRGKPLDRLEIACKRAFELGANESAAEYKEQLVFERDLTQSLLELLGLERLDRSGDRLYRTPGVPSVETIRTSFAAWLAADLATERALGHRGQAIANVSKSLLSIVEQLNAAETALEKGSPE